MFALKCVIKYCVRLWISLAMLLGQHCCAQHHHVSPETAIRAREIADSIAQTRKFCDDTGIALTNYVYYPMSEENAKVKRRNGHYFNYVISLHEGVALDLSILLNDDLTVRWINDIPDKNAAISPCHMLTLDELWRIVQRNGCKGKRKRYRYDVVFEENRLSIKFRKRRTRWDIDEYVVDANTGEFVGHIQKNVHF